MERFLQVMKVVTLAAITFFFAFSAYAVRQAQMRLGPLATEAQTFLADTHKRTNAILVHADVVMGRAQVVMGQAEKASRRQQEVSDQTLLMMKHGDQVLTDTAVTVKQIGDAFDEAGDSVVASMQELNKATAELVKAEHDLDVLLTDPNVVLTAQNVQVATANVAAATANVNASTKRIDDRLTQMLKPGSLVKNLFKTLLGMGSQVRLISGK